jgi:hypothetical protein
MGSGRQRQHRRLNRHDGFALFFEHVPPPPVIADCGRYGLLGHNVQHGPQHEAASMKGPN